MHTADAACCLSLLRLRGVGAVAAGRLLEAAGSAEHALSLGEHELRALGLADEAVGAILQHPPRPDERALRDLDWLQRSGTHLLSILDPGYPSLLREIACPPPALFVQGQCGLLSSHQLAMVGSRRPTPGGRETARRLASELAQYALTITSGLAIGIDTESHLGALGGGGPTVAVMGTGLDRVYPLRNAALAARIRDSGGVLVSEFLPGTPPEAANFPRRNRIISGLSLGVLVVESGLPSGSLLTAQYAVEQNRDVMAVPGSVYSPVSRGCHALLRSGAALVENAGDVLDALGLHRASAGTGNDTRPVAPNRDAPSLGEATRAVFESVGFEQTSLDTVVRRSGLSAAAVAAAVAELEVRGLVSRCPGGLVREPPPA
jgi:DNA processing protein